jgi:membrane protein implicated in regulation of membrane protease activity
VKAPSVFRRYLLFQVPGWIVAATLAAVSTHWPGLRWSTAVLLFAAWVAKDLALYRFVRHGYVPGDGEAHRSLLGARGVAEQPLAPTGWVRVRGELWRARLLPGATPVAKGSPVRVVAVDGMEIVVEERGQVTQYENPHRGSGLDPRSRIE